MGFGILPPNKRTMITETNTPDSGSNERPLFLMDILEAVESIRQHEEAPVHFPINVQLKPRVFYTHFTIEIITDHSMELNIVFRSAAGQIIRMFNWQLIAGANVTAVQDLGHLLPGSFQLEIFTTDAALLYSGELAKD